MEFPVVNGVTTVMPAPEGYVVDFENPQRQFDVEHYAIFAGLGTLAMLFLVQRVYTKIFIAGGMQVDDSKSVWVVLCDLADLSQS
jgi:hypothetical protein